MKTGSSLRVVVFDHSAGKLASKIRRPLLMYRELTLHYSLCYGRYQRVQHLVNIMFDSLTPGADNVLQR
jgi:hypothetical protein